VITMTENFDVERMLTPISDNLSENYVDFIACFV